MGAEPKNPIGYADHPHDSKCAVCGGACLSTFEVQRHSDPPVNAGEFPAWYGPAARELLLKREGAT